MNKEEDQIKRLLESLDRLNKMLFLLRGADDVKVN